MFGIGFPEMILILALALIVVGPDKLPDLARSLAKTVLDLKKAAEGLKESIDLEDNPLSEIKPELEDAAKNFKDTILDAETHTWKDSTIINNNDPPQPGSTDTPLDPYERLDNNQETASRPSDEDPNDSGGNNPHSTSPSTDS